MSYTTQKMHSQLRDFFKSKGIRQKDLMQQLGITQSYTSALMTGRIAMSRNIAKKLSELYGLSEGWLLTGDGPMMKGDPPTPPECLQLPLAEQEGTPLADIIRKQQELLNLKERELATLREVTQSLIKLLPGYSAKQA